MIKSNGYPGIYEVEQERQREINLHMSKMLKIVCANKNKDLVKNSHRVETICQGEDQ